MSNRYKGAVISATPPTTTGGESGTASGAWTLEQQMQLTAAGLWPIQPLPKYIEDVFSTWLYTGNGSTQTITNGIDLSGKGGLVWGKLRSTSDNNWWIDTVRGNTKKLVSNSTAAEGTTTFISSFNSNGFSIGDSNPEINTSNYTYVSWTFREQPKFFDVVTFTSAASGNTTFSHNLGSTPGCVFIKNTQTADPWIVYHRSTGDSQWLYLNTTAAAASDPNIFSATSTTFTIKSTFTYASQSYVAYLFAHDAGGFGASGTDNVISCGSFSTSGGAATVTLGYEPQWILWKRTDSAQNWNVYDNMRGWAQENVAQLYPNLTQAEDFYSGNYFTPTSTGFQLNSSFGLTGSYIYVAIRRGPMAVPTVGTSVFYPNAVAQADSPDSSGVPFQPDLINTFSRDGSNRANNFSYFQFVDRLRGAGIPNNTRVAVSEGRGLVSSSTTEEYGTTAPFTYVQLKANSQDITRGAGWNSTAYGNWIYYFFKRAPSFFDEVCYTGTGTGTVTHNLGVVPELIIVKNRSTAGYDWKTLTTSPTAGTLNVNTTAALNTSDNPFYFGNGSSYVAPTSTQFSVYNNYNVGVAGERYVAYLFATCPGVSKVGSYTGNAGNTVVVPCGFTAGARFVLIKRTDSTGAWYVWDSARGIVSGNDPYLLLNSTAAEVTGTDYVDTYAAGFEVTSTAPAGLNATGGTYIFLAIA